MKIKQHQNFDIFMFYKLLYSCSHLISLKVENSITRNIDEDANCIVYFKHTKITKTKTELLIMKCYFKSQIS